MKEIIVQSAPKESAALMELFDRELYKTTYFWRSFANSSYVQNEIRKSNKEFEAIADVNKLIESRDKSWIENDNTVKNQRWYKDIFENFSAQELVRTLALYNEEKYGNMRANEVFITNKYGVSAIESNRTTDYLQADEEWWQVAKENGVYIGNVEYDSSVNGYGLSVGIKIVDDNGGFLGVAKLVLDLDRAEDIFAKQLKNRMLESGKTTGLVGGKLVDSAGDLIYGFGGLPYTEKYRNAVLGMDGGMNVKEYVDSSSGKNFLISSAGSKGFLDNPGLKWQLLLENDEEIIFSPIAKSARVNLMIILMVLVLVFVVLFIMTRFIARVFRNLDSAVEKVARGNFDTRIEIDSRDEFGKLAGHFNQMARELQENKKSRDEFVSIAVHQLKTPMTAMKWLLELLLEKRGQVMPEEVKKNVNEVYLVVLQLISTVTDLLRVFRMERKEILNDFVILEVNSKIKNIVDSMSALIRAKSIAMHLDLASTDIKVKINEDMFREIFENLLSNAIKYSHFGGEVTIETLVSGDRAWIKVVDQGLGIPTEDQRNLFERFFRASNVKKMDIEGTGLGLYIVKANCQLWGGNVDFKSVEGVGSTFTVNLPLAS